MSFGNTTTQPTGSLFGGSTFGAQPSQPAQGSSLFGGSTLGQQPQQQPTGGLFGSNQQQQQQTQPTGSLFGGLGQNQNQNQNQNAAQTAPLGGLFGQNQQQPQQQQQQPAGSLFGGSTTGGGLFGGASSTANTATNTNATTSGGLFGQSSTSGFGLGNAQANKPQTLNTFGTNPLFKQPSQPTNLGATTTQQQAGAPPFTKSTRFNDLPDNIKKVFEGIDTHIQGRIQISNDLRRRKLGEEASRSQDLIRGVHKELVSVISDLQSDAHHVRDLKAKTEQTVQDTIVATRIIDGFRNPQQHGVYLKNHASFPLEFFQRVTDEMRDRMRWYKTTIEQIERKLSSAALQSQATPHAIQSTLEAQHGTFIALASKTAALDAELQKIKALYTQLWRARTGSMRDPFDDLDRVTGDFGLESLSGK